MEGEDRGVVKGFFGAYCLFPPCQHDLGLRKEGLAQGRSMHARTVRIGAHCEKSRRRMAAGDSGQDPGEMVIAGVPPVLVRWGKVGFRNCSLNVADVGKGDGHASKEWEHPREAM